MSTGLINDSEFKQWLKDLKVRIRQSQLKAAVKVNIELVHLYWDLGRDITIRKMDAIWGSRFYDNLSKELKAEFPDMKGFSKTNLKYCKYFYQLYSLDDQIRQQLADEFIDNPLFMIPWGHHMYIIDKCESVHEALFYDLLFYHLELRCYLVVEFKVSEFEPEHTGKLGYYISAVNHKLKKDADNPTIGLLICKKKDNIEAQYSLESSSQPIGISEYTLSKFVPEDFKSSLPSIEEIERELNLEDGENREKTPVVP